MTRRTRLILLATLFWLIVGLLIAGGEKLADWLADAPGGEYTPQPELWRLSVG